MDPANYSRREVLRLAIPALSGAFLADKLLAEPSAPERLLFSFGLLGDPQYADVNPAGSRHYRASLGKLKSCIARLNQEDLEFVVTVGDIIDRAVQNREDDEALTKLQAESEDLCRKFPLYPGM